jgi:AraC-like DNA-binding protein
MLRRSRLFRNYEQVFSEATGLALALRPVDYWQLEHQGKKNENPFCALLAERPATLSVCLQAHDQMIRHTGDLPHTVTCPFGLTETAVPIKLGEQTIGYLRIGQVLRHMPAKTDTTKVSRELERCGVRFSGEIRKAWERNPLIPSEKYNATVRLLAFFADQLSALSNQLLTEKNNSEPPLVLKAREYIDKHKNEELSLADVAKTAGASVFHFCKVFHKATGLTFTDYVARIRLEDARTRLLNPNLRVSEIAYDVGFQSLTQFNRTFKRVFGQSPSEFRARLSSRKRAGKPA